MELSAGSFTDIELCLVSTFRLDVPFRKESNSDNGLRGAYEEWKADVKSKLLEKNDSGCLTWSTEENSSGDMDFTKGCFLRGKIDEKKVDEGEVDKVDCFVSILNKLDGFKGISKQDISIELKLWEFGIGSVKVNIDLKSLVGNNTVEIAENDIIAELGNNGFYTKLELLIESEIICRFKLNDESDSNIKSFAEKVMQYRDIKSKQPVGKLFDSRILIKLDVEDSNFAALSTEVSKGLYNLCIEENLPAENFGIYCSKGKDIIVFLHVDSDDSVDSHDSIEYIIERILVQVSFLQYINNVGEIYKMFFVANFRKLNEEKIRQSKRINKLFFKGGESVIVRERKNVNLIYKEIDYISQVISKSNYQLNRLFASKLNFSESKIIECLSNLLNLVTQRDIAEQEYNSIKNEYNKIDKIASDEASTGRARAYHYMNILLLVFLYLYQVYRANIDNDDNVTRDRILTSVILLLILLYVLRSFVLYLTSYFYKQIEIYKYYKSKDLKPNQLWILMIQKKRCIHTIQLILVSAYIFYWILQGVIFFVRLSEKVSWILIIILIIYLLRVGAPQTSDPTDTEPSTTTIAKIETSLPSSILPSTIPTSTLSLELPSTSVPTEEPETPESPTTTSTVTTVLSPHSGSTTSTTSITAAPAITTEEPETSDMSIKVEIQVLLYLLFK